MDKAAFRSAAGKLRHAKRLIKTTVQKYPEIPYGIGGAVGAGGLTLGLTHAAKKWTEKQPSFKKLKPATKEKRKKEMNKAIKWGTIGNAILGGLEFASLGADLGSHRRYMRAARKASKGAGRYWKGRSSYGGYGGYARPPKADEVKVPDWLKGVKTKADAKTKFREQAKTHHPDRGGSEEKMKKVNSEWDNFQKHHFNKLAFLMPSFLDELRRIREASR